MQAMNAAVFVPSNLNSSSANVHRAYGRSDSSESAPFSPIAPLARESDRSAQGLSGNFPGILIRKLPRNLTDRELKAMFLMARDHVDSDFVQNERAEDKGFATAIARFRSPSAAQDVKAKLDGRSSSADEENMVVEFLSAASTNSYLLKRFAFDSTNRNGKSSSSTSSASSNGPTGNAIPRFNGGFPTIDNMSPPGHSSGLEYGNSPGSGEFPGPDSNSHFKNLFSPQSPIGNQLNETSRVTGKSMINSDSLDDDETGELLRDPVAYAENGNNGLPGSMPRRQTNPAIPISRFNNLTLATSSPGPGAHSYPSPVRGGPVQTPGSAMSPMNMGPLGPNTNYQLSSQYHQRPNYPPVNPADQNPPCNTLYVGNLPIDTSEDELKAMFSKQRGYKRLCFRTKQQGPMCFVEFEDVSFATKALNELYGYPLHNSVKGGIRLSFSKNPLGVRSGQQNSAIGLSTPTTPHSNMAPGSNLGGGISGGLGGPPYSSAAGPPPGLSAPPGLNSSLGMPGAVPVPSMANGMVMPNSYASGAFAVGGQTHPMGGFRPPMPMGSSILGQTGSGAQPNGGGGNFSDYMMGR